MRLTGGDSSGEQTWVMKDLMWGVGTREVRLLVDNPWEGGGGYTPYQVGRMTLDEIYMRLTDAKILRAGINNTRTARLPAYAVTTDKDGYVKGRDRHGNPIRAKIKGESLASRLIREQREQQEHPKLGHHK